MEECPFLNWPDRMAALDVRWWFENTRGRTASAGLILFLLVVIVGLALAGFDPAVSLLFALIGYATGLAAGYLASVPLRRRGTNDGRIRLLFALWGAYVLAVTGALVFGLTDRRTGSTGAVISGVQSFGLSFWLLLMFLSRNTRAAGAWRWMLKGFGLYVSGVAAGLLAGVFLTVYVFVPLTR